MKKTRWLLYAIFGLVFYLLFLIIEMPASWFAWGLNRYTQGSVRLDPTSGSLWGGKGRLVVYYPPTTPHEFGQTEWRINPLWLLAGRVQLSLNSNHQDRRVKTTLGLGRQRYLLKDTEAEFPAAFVARLFTPLALISPQGKIRITAEDLALSPEKVEGSASLEWLNAGSNLSGVQPLGDYRLEIAGAEKHANLKLATLRGDLEFAGQGQYQPSTGQIQFTGSAIARKRTAELEPILNLLGQGRGDGSRSLVLNTRIPLLRP